MAADRYLVSLTVGGHENFNYFSTVCPRVGEEIEADHNFPTSDHYRKVYRVLAVRHRRNIDN